MTKYKLTIVLDDSGADDNTDPISSAVSNLEYDNYGIISATIEKSK